MSKLSFRARALDATKPMPIYQKHELSDLQDYSVLNRAVPQMPSGMEKEEESEHHLQRAISAQQVYGDAKVMVIPVPEAEVSLACYNNLYKKSFRLPKHYIHNQAQALNSILEQEKPDYDMDSEDERWVKDTNKRVGLDVTHDQFEEMIDRLEKSCGKQIVTLQEAKLLLKEDDDLIKAVYDYWTKKRSRFSGSLIYQVRQERRDGSSSNDCYVAFRRRTEKMQTRKNRKNDESSYEKMLKLRRELSRAVTILEMVKRREKSKRELLHLTLEVFEKRYQMKDWDCKYFRSIKKELHAQRARAHFRAFGGNASQYRRKRHTSASISKNKQAMANPPSISRGELDREIIMKKLKKKRQRQPAGGAMPTPTTLTSQSSKELNGRLNLQNKVSSAHHPPSSSTKSTTPRDVLSYQDVVDTMTQYEFPPSSDEDVKSPHAGTSPSESFDAKKFPDGIFTFRRKPGCKYYAPRDDVVGDWPWMSDPKHRYSLTSLSVPDKCIGFTRRRMGRGGRVMLDRAYHPYNRDLEQLDIGKEHEHLPPTRELEDLLSEIKRNRWRHYRPSRGTLPPQTEHIPNEAESLMSWNSSQFNYEFGKNLDQSDSKLQHHGSNTKKLRQNASKSHHKRVQGSATLELDKSSVAFAMSALVTVATPTAVTMTATGNNSKITRVTSSVTQSKVATSKSDVSSAQKCMTCGGIVTLTSTVTDSRTNMATFDQQKALPVSLSLASTIQSTGQRTTVLPATVTVSMSRAGGGTHTTGVPALLRISSSGPGVSGDIATLRTLPNSGTIVQPRKSGQRTQRGSVNVNLALPANVLASINNESSSLRATQSAPNSPRSSQGRTNDASDGTTAKSSSRPTNAKTISLNLGSLTTTHAQTFIPTTFVSSGHVNQVLNAGRITIAGNMLKLGGGAVFSVALPQNTKPPSTSTASSTATTGGDNALVVSDGNIVLTKMDENKNKARTKNEQPRSDLKPMTLTTLNPTLKKSQLATRSEDNRPLNHTVQINIGSPAKVESGTPSNILDPLAAVVTVATNTVPVKSSKPSRPMEVT